MPQLFVASGATTFGRDYKQYPWTIGFQPSYRAEGWIYGTYLARDEARRQDRASSTRTTTTARTCSPASSRASRARRSKVVAAQPYEVDRRRRAVADRAAEGVGRERAGALRDARRSRSRATSFANRLGWRPLIINNAVSSASNIMTLASEGGTNKAVENSISIVFLKDPTDAEVAERRGDEALPLDHGAVRARARTRRTSTTSTGWRSPTSSSRLLKAAGKNPTRAVADGADARS